MIEFTQSDRKYVFVLDTGSEQSVLIKESIDDFVYTPLNQTGSIYGIEGNIQETPLVAAKFFCKKQDYVDIFHVHDGQKMMALLGKDEVKITGILGNTFFSRYRCYFDYNHYKLITYGHGIKR